MRQIDLNISPQNFYFILITVFVAGFFGFIIFLSTQADQTSQGLPSPSPVDFAKVLGTSQQPKSEQPLTSQYQIGPNPNEKYQPTPAPKTPPPTPIPEITASPSPTLQPSNSPEPTPTNTSTPTSTLNPLPAQ